MEDVLKQAKTVIEVPAELPVPEPETNNNARDFGILVGVVVVAAICAKLYKCTSKKK